MNKILRNVPPLQKIYKYQQFIALYRSREEQTQDFRMKK